MEVQAGSGSPGLFSFYSQAAPIYCKEKKEVQFLFHIA
jgi:hypothetical protein